MFRRQASQVLILMLTVISATAGLSQIARAVQEPQKKEKQEEKWPETKAGERAREWVEAYSSGEAAMRRFITANNTPESLRERPMAERLESYRQMQERIPRLRLGYLLRSTPYEVEAMLIAQDGSKHKFVFSVENKEPHRLLSVAYHQTPGQGHGHGQRH